jgi:hypothetical protein
MVPLLVAAVHCPSAPGAGTPVSRDAPARTEVGANDTLYGSGSDALPHGDDAGDDWLQGEDALRREPFDVDQNGEVVDVLIGDDAPDTINGRAWYR